MSECTPEIQQEVLTDLLSPLETAYFDSIIPTQNKVNLDSGRFADDCSDLNSTLLAAQSRVKDFDTGDLIQFEVLNNSVRGSIHADKAIAYIDNFASVMTQQTELIDQEIDLNDVTLQINTTIFEFVQSEKDFAILYPDLNDRLQENTIITNVEVADFILDYGIKDYNKFVLDFGKPYVVGSIDEYYSKGTKFGRNMRSFCTLIKSIFAAATVIFDAFGDLKAFIGKVQNFLANLKDFSIAKLIDTIKQKIIDTINDIVQSIKRKIQSITAFFQNFAASMNAKFIRIKQDIAKFFSDTNIAKIKERIEASIGNVVDMFENPTMKEIQYIIYRFCQLMSTIEDLFNLVVSPMSILRAQYDYAKRTLQSNGDYNSAFALSAGAIRPTRQEYEAGVQRGYAIAREQGGAESVYVPPRQSEIDGIPSWEQIRQQVDADGRIVLSSTISGDVYVPGSNMGREGWDRTTVEARVSLLRLQRYFSDAVGNNVKFTINSAYRSPEYNRVVGGDTGSKHMSGTAFDISSRNFPRGSEAIPVFVRCAKQAGFKGFGYYSTFIHVDLGPSREWGRR